MNSGLDCWSAGDEHGAIAFHHCPVLLRISNPCRCESVFQCGSSFRIRPQESGPSNGLRVGCGDSEQAGRFLQNESQVLALGQDLIPATFGNKAVAMSVGTAPHVSVSFHTAECQDLKQPVTVPAPCGRQVTNDAVSACRISAATSPVSDFYRQVACFPGRLPVGAC